VNSWIGVKFLLPILLPISVAGWLLFAIGAAQFPLWGIWYISRHSEGTIWKVRLYVILKIFYYFLKYPISLICNTFFLIQKDLYFIILQLFK